MLKFHLKLQNNMITTNLLYAIISFIILFNILIRLFPYIFIDVSSILNHSQFVKSIIPVKLFTYCDVYILILFIVIIFFTLGIDFNNSMEEISLAIGGSKTNKFMIRKLFSMLFLYMIMYTMSFINIYSLYIKLVDNKVSIMPFKEIILCSFTANIFIISLSLLVLFLVRDIAVIITIITSYYLIEESLWRGKLLKKYGILGHLYNYYDYSSGEMIRIKIIFILISLVLLLTTYKLSWRKRNNRLF